MITIERMDYKHIEDVICLGLVTQEFRTGTSAPQFYFRSTLEAWIKSPNGVLLVGLFKSEFAGFSIAAYNPDNKDGYLHNIVVMPEHRHKGIAPEMLEKTLQNLAILGCNHVYKKIKPRNKEALKLMQKYGFEIGEKFLYVERTLEL